MMTMNINYSFTISESIAVISLAALIMFLAVWILMFFDTWRQRRKYSQLKKQMNLTEKRETKWTPPQGKEWY
ncbi:LapA family protein [Salmonella enterica subsp. diarizonae]|nr:LapA family protein [Salmonella enterica subsp. enterica serovar Richmond]ECJ2330868.1 LapA family protein [Salmonella enterica subsp. diarizonae]ECJ2469962.1 LapA family protein [Salmonella enterica subsp. diarizonae]ECJ5157959.1 LapA family protein [Salmonella enterica subsp. enterica serovar Richmond]EDU3719839.1 LapA family protein [Salmonella enterica subsp. diarizonae]